MTTTAATNGSARSTSAGAASITAPARFCRCCKTPRRATSSTPAASTAFGPLSGHASRIRRAGRVGRARQGNDNSPRLDGCRKARQPDPAINAAEDRGTLSVLGVRAGVTEIPAGPLPFRRHGVLAGEHARRQCQKQRSATDRADCCRLIQKVVEIDPMHLNRWRPRAVYCGGDQFPPMPIA